jgi:tripartite-type tricarboxylate transporter receptor subunit TctC
MCCPKLLVSLFSTMLLIDGMPHATAQDYPTRTVTIIVPFTPAGATDILGRMAAAALEAQLGKSFVVENRPGAGQQIGVNAVARAAPDGYTLLVATSSAMAINPTLYKKISYDPVKDFQPIAMLAHLPFILVVNNDLPVKSVAELIEYAKDHPGKLSFGSGGVGASHHLYGELFKSLTGTQMTHVPYKAGVSHIRFEARTNPNRSRNKHSKYRPDSRFVRQYAIPLPYKGTMPALNDLIAGHIQVLFADSPPVLPQIEGGKVRALGVTTAKRIPATPEIPTIAETVPGFDSAPWQMLSAPNGTPASVTDKLHKEITSYVASPEGQKKLMDMGLVPGASTPPTELAKFVINEVDAWGQVVRKAGVAGIE